MDEYRSCYLRAGADKSLAKPGKELTTANKLGIYSTYEYFQRRWINFLDRGSNSFLRM